jgi:hypothetical protein
MLSLTYQPQPPTAILNRHFQFLLKDRMTDKTSPTTAREENPIDVVLSSICFLFLAVFGISLASCFKPEALPGRSKWLRLHVSQCLPSPDLSGQRPALLAVLSERSNVFVPGRCVEVDGFDPQSRSTSCPACVGWGVEGGVRQSGPLDDDMSGPEACSEERHPDAQPGGPLLAWPSRMSGVHESSSSHGSEPIRVVPLSPPRERKFQLVVRKTNTRSGSRPSRSWCGEAAILGK